MNSKVTLTVLLIAVFVSGSASVPLATAQQTQPSSTRPSSDDSPGSNQDIVSGFTVDSRIANASWVEMSPQQAIDTELKLIEATALAIYPSECVRYHILHHDQNDLSKSVNTTDLKGVSKGRFFYAELRAISGSKLFMESATIVRFLRGPKWTANYSVTSGASELVEFNGDEALYQMLGSRPLETSISIPSISRIFYSSLPNQDEWFSNSVANSSDLTLEKKRYWTDENSSLIKYELLYKSTKSSSESWFAVEEWVFHSLGLPIVIRYRSTDEKGREVVQKDLLINNWTNDTRGYDSYPTYAQALFRLQVGGAGPAARISTSRFDLMSIHNHIESITFGLDQLSLAAGTIGRKWIDGDRYADIVVSNTGQLDVQVPSGQQYETLKKSSESVNQTAQQSVSDRRVLIAVFMLIAGAVLSLGVLILAKISKRGTI